jgi:hypothetical protein
MILVNANIGESNGVYRIRLAASYRRFLCFSFFEAWYTHGELVPALKTEDIPRGGRRESFRSSKSYKTPKKTVMGEEEEEGKRSDGR